MTLHIGFLLFPDVQQLDLTGPFEVFASLPGTATHLIAATMAPVSTATGLVLTPTKTYDACPPLDVICVPGGVGVNALLTDAAALAFLRRQAAGAKFVASVCTGALVLGAAGLLRGRRATTHWAAHDMLAAFGAHPVKARIVRDGTLFTGGGVTAGIDVALDVAAALFGREAAESVQLELEYAPQPPFAAGTPETAPPAIVASAWAAVAAGRAVRQAIIVTLAQEGLMY